MHEEAVAAPAWIGGFVLILCGLVSMGALLIAVVSGVLLARRNGAKSREFAELNHEIARLRDRIEQLEKDQATVRSTQIKES